MTRILPLALILASAPIVPAHAQTARFTAITGGSNVGHLWVDRQGNRTTVDDDIRNKGREPTIAETSTTGPDGLPTSRSVAGATTLGDPIFD